MADDFNFAESAGKTARAIDGGDGKLRQAVADAAVAAEGWTTHRLISAASTNATSIKGSAGRVRRVIVSNINAATRYLKLYDKASAPTVGTDVPVLTISLKGGTVGGAESIDIDRQFTNGIAIALTTGVGDSDTGAVAANEQVIHTVYK